MIVVGLLQVQQASVSKCIQLSQVYKTLCIANIGDIHIVEPNYVFTVPKGRDEGKAEGGRAGGETKYVTKPVMCWKPRGVVCFVVPCIGLYAINAPGGTKPSPHIKLC